MTDRYTVTALTVAVLLLSIFAVILIDQTPTEECIKTKEVTTCLEYRGNTCIREKVEEVCELRAIIWDNHKWMEVE